jgi:signal transduction histidine kinase
VILARLIKLKRLVGPYPYNPYLIFLFFFSIFFSRFVPLVGYLPPGHERWRAAALIILVSAIPSGIFAGGSLLLKRFRFWSSESTFLYILEVTFFVFINLKLLLVVNSIIKTQLTIGYETLVAHSFNIFMASLFLSLVALALMHQGERKISDRLLIVTKLVDKLENERADLISADELLRKQTSQFLHDRVQSDLMVVGMKLKSISGQSSPEVNEIIERAIIRLENTRASDLKNLIQVLAPNFEGGTLSTAIDAMLEQYKQSMDISVQISESIETLNPDVKLGVYRIIEQAMLNALVHGPATKVQIIITDELESSIKIIVSDNGPGTTIEEVSPGVGSAIIDSWVGILGGKRSIDSSLGYGYRLEVEFPR